MEIRNFPQKSVPANLLQLCLTLRPHGQYAYLSLYPYWRVWRMSRCHHRPTLYADASILSAVPSFGPELPTLRMPKDEPVQLKANSRPWSSPPGLRGQNAVLRRASAREPQGYPTVSHLALLPAPGPAMFLLLAGLAALGGLLASQGRTGPQLPSPLWVLKNGTGISWGAISVAPRIPAFLGFSDGAFLPPSATPDQDRMEDVSQDAMSQPLKVFLGHTL